MAFIVEFLDEAIEQLKTVALRDRRAIWRRILRLGEDPHGPGTSALRHELQGYWKLRVGDYRVIYEVQGSRMVVLVVTVGHRRHVYEAAQRIAKRRRG